MSPAARLAWFGHSTVVVELDGTTLVTDPVLGRRIAHLWRRARPPDLGPVDGVLVSHLHYDHLDLPSLRRIPRDAVLVVPHGSEQLVYRLGFARVETLRCGATLRIGAVDVEAVHADHVVSPRRGVEAAALGYVLRGGSRAVYFAGDTDVYDDMRLLAPGLDVALLPVGGWGPRVPEGHLDPTRAARALELLQPRIAVPIHWGTFAPFGLRRLGGSHTAAREFEEEAARRAPATDVRILEPGDWLTL